MNSTRGVLIVESNPLTRLGVVAVVQLHSLLHVCAETGDARAARELCLVHRPDLVVLSLVVRQGDGLELIREIADLHPGARTVVIGLPGEGVYVNRALRAGAMAFITSDEEPTELLSALEHALCGKRFISMAAASLMAESAVDPVVERLQLLSDRELHVFRRLGRRQGPSEIASELAVSVKTVETYQRRIREKLGVADGRKLGGLAAQWLEQRRSADGGRPPGFLPRQPRESLPRRLAPHG